MRAVSAVKYWARHTHKILLQGKDKGFLLPRYSPYRTKSDTFYPLGEKWLRPECLRGSHFNGSMVELEDSPHFSFVVAHHSNGGSRAHWQQYKVAQHGNSREETLTMTKDFENLIAYVARHRFQTVILVEKQGNFYRILDGFHRAAILTYLFPERRIRCAVV